MRRRMSSGFTTSAVRPSSGSKRAKGRSSLNSIQPLKVVECEPLVAHAEA
jgi:hypothetical protein